MRSFASGELRAKISSRSSCSSASSSCSLMPSSSSPATTVGSSPPDADLPRDRRRRQAVVAGDDDDADARRAWQRGDGVGDLRPRAGRSSRRARGRELALRLLAALGHRSPAPSRRRATPSTRRPSRGVAVDQPLDLARAPPRRAAAPPVRRRRRRAAGQQRLRRALGVHPQLAVALVDRRHQLQHRVEVELAPAPSRSRSAHVDVGARARGRLEHRHLGGIAAARRRARELRRCCTRPSPPRARERRSGLAARRGGRPRLEVERLRAPVQTAVTRMRFSVSVPVLSVQITSVEPSVSTALRRFTTAPRRTSSRTPTASASVITGSRPSGTLPTSRPDREDDRVGEARGRRRSARAGQRRLPSTTAISAISQATRRTWPSSGLSSRSTRSRERRDPAQLGVHAGREDDRPGLALGAGGAGEHQVARLRAAARCVSSSRPSGTPASTRRSASRGPPRRRRSSRRASAEMRSPSSITSTSPGTSRVASTSSLAPVAQHLRVRGQVAGERLDRPLGLHLLGEREAPR